MLPASSKKISLVDLSTFSFCISLPGIGSQSGESPDILDARLTVLYGCETLSKYSLKMKLFEKCIKAEKNQ